MTAAMMAEEMALMLVVEMGVEMVVMWVDEMVD